MKKWKKVMIVALCVLAVSVAALVYMAGVAFYREYHNECYWENVTRPVSRYIVMEYGIKARKNFVQLKDIRTGKHTTPQLQHIFINSYSSSDSLVVFRTFDRMRGYINIHTGQIVIPAQYNRAWNFSEGIAAVFKDGFISFINTEGEPAFNQTFPIFYDDDYSDIAFQFHNGLCVMRTMDNKWGLINAKGEWVVEPIYSSIYKPWFGYRIVTDGARYGLLTKEGKVALPLEYDLIRFSSDGNGFFIAKDGYAKIIDKQLKTVVPFAHNGLCELKYGDDDEYDGYGNSGTHTPEFWRYDIGYGSGVIDRQCNVIIPAKYYMIRMVNENMFEAVVSPGGDCILFDRKGRPVGQANF